MITGPKKYLEFFAKYKERTLTVDDGLDLFQFLLDTDQQDIDSETAKMADYLIDEGFLYFIYSGD